MISDIYELSPVQAGMLFQHALAPDSVAYFNQFSCRLTGPLQVAHLRTAWQQLLDRHQVLRTSFHWEGLGHPVQVVHDTAILPWTQEDWRDLSPEEAQSRWTGWLAADRARGFDPGVAPLMRVGVIQVSEDDHRLCWSHHHLILDGWCLSLLLDELFTRYSALCAGQRPVVTDARPYGEYIAWLRRQDRAAYQNYWRQALAGLDSTTPLPGALPALLTPDTASPDARCETRLSATDTAALLATAGRHRLTLAVLIQGAWALLLARHAGTPEVTFGTTVAGRPPELAGVARMLGVFINTVPVRVAIDGAQQTGEWLRALLRAQVERDRHAAISLGDIQKVSPLPPGSPLFSSHVIVMNYPLDDALVRGGAGLTIREVTVLDQTELPLTLQAVPGAELQLELLFDHRWVDEGMARRLLDQVAWVLRQFASGLDQPLDSLDIVPPAERARLVDTFNATDAPLDTRATALDHWHAQVAARPDAIALVCGTRRLTYRDADARSTRLAVALRRRAAVTRDALVALAFRRSERMVLAILAIWKCGGAYVPIDPDYPDSRIRQILDVATPVALLRDEGDLGPALEAEYAGRLTIASVDGLDQDVVDPAPPLAPDLRPTGGDLAYVIFTSGSTGQPKGAMVEHTGMLNHLLAKVEDFRLGPDSVVVQNASHCFDISVWQSFAGLIVGGRTLVYGDALVLNPQALLDQVRLDRVTVLEVVPSYLSALLDLLQNIPAPLPDLTVLLVTGEVVKPALVQRWFERYPEIPLANAYGPTEASDDITHAILRAPVASPTVPIGRPLRNFRIYIVDAQMRLCPIGVAGELCVSGPGVGRGYLKDPARTAAAFLTDPFRVEPGVRMYRTGDIGMFTGDGTLLLAGRRDDQVKVRGYRIELGDIESALTGLPGVRDAVVVVRRDERSDRSALAAYVALQHGADASGVSLLTELASRLPEYMVPATCTVLDALPLTPNGKVDRTALPAPQPDAARPDASRRPPRTPVEATLVAIWSQVLGIEPPGTDENFFALGGDSILSMQIVSRAARAGLVCTPRDLFRHQTIAELAQVVTLASTGSQVDASPGSAPLLPAQAAFVAEALADPEHYNQSLLLEVPAGCSAAHLETAIARVVAHHEALRLRIARHDGEWRQSTTPEAAGFWTVHDLPEAELEDQLRTLHADASTLQASLNPAEGRVFRAALFRRGPDARDLLLLVAHHLVVDGVSWRALLDDLAAAYDAAASGITVRLPQAPSVLAWATALAATGADTSWQEAELAYWTDPVRLDVVRVPMTPGPTRPGEPDRGVGIDTVDSSAERNLVLDAATTAQLLAVTAAPDRVGTHDALVAATGLAMAEWAGQGPLLIDLETHGRHNPLTGADGSRVVGWLTATYPLWLHLSGADGADAAVRHVARQRRQVPHEGFGYGLLRFAAGRDAAARLAAMPAAELLVNYHGHVAAPAASGWRVLDVPQGEVRSRRQALSYLFEVDALVSDGQFRVSLRHGRRRVSDEAAAAFVSLLERHLRRIAGTGATPQLQAPVPEDFPLAHLDQRALDTLLASTGPLADLYPLAPTQEGILFHALRDQDSGAYFNQLTCVLEGPLDPAAFREAWRLTAARHAALRTSFHWLGLERPLQAVHPEVALPWQEDDWSARDAGTQDQWWNMAAEADRRVPFDLATAPLMRAALLRVSPTRHRFRWSQHHLLLDGWSAAIVLGDVLACYRSLAAGVRPELPPVVPYRQAVAWLQARQRAEDEAYWREALRGFTAPTALPLGLPALQGTANRGPVHDVERVLDTTRTAAARALAAHAGLTLNTLVQGVWAAQLSRYSDTPDVVFGAIVSGRPATLEGAQEMVGLFINAVPVRARVEPGCPALDWLRALQQTQADSEPYAHAALADIQNWSELEPGTALFDSIVIFENYPAVSQSEEIGALAIREVSASEPNNYPLTLVVTPGDQLAIKLMYDSGRFDLGTAQRTVGHFTTLLAALVDAPATTLEALPMLTHEECDSLTVWNATGAPLPDDTVPARIEAVARRTPDRVAVRCGHDTTTYGELEARASALAHTMRASVPMQPEARVAVLLRRSARLPEVVLAIWKCGAAYVPVDPDAPAERVALILARAQPTLIVVDHSTPVHLDVTRLATQAAVLHLDQTRGYGAARPPLLASQGTSPDSLAYVIFTSGSTGVPKGAMLEHRGFLNHVLSMCDELTLAERSVVAQTASHGFDISMWQLFAGLVAGGTTVIYPDALVHAPLRLAGHLAADGVTVAQFVPSYLNVFLDAVAPAPEPPVTPWPTLTHMVVIGEALGHPTVERWFRAYPGVPLMNAYGPTEASDSVAHLVLTAPPPGTVVPIGRPIRNLTLYVVDHAKRQCPTGVKGEICIGGVGVGRGYLFDAARTAEVFTTDPFGAGGRLYRTGDVGCLGPDGLLYFFGRRDFQVKIRGHRIELGDVEAALVALDGVRDAAVLAREVAGDTVLCAFVAPRAAAAVTAEGLLLALGHRLPRYAVPATLELMDALPVLSSGKLDRKALASRSAPQREAPATPVAVTETERQVQAIWQEVLQREAVPLDASFFDLGGHSLKAMQVVGRLARTFGVELPLGTLFEHPTVRALALALEGLERNAPALVAGPVRADYPVTPMQRRIWLASRTPEGSAGYNMTVAVWLSGVVDLAALEGALTFLLARHEVLRTAFVMTGGELRQRVCAEASLAVPLEVRECAGWSDEEVDAALATEAAAAFDLSVAPLLKVTVLRVSDHRLLVCVRLHHVIGDGQSMRLLLDELLAGYAAISRGDIAQATPLEVQYRDYVTWRLAHAAAAGDTTEQHLWEAYLAARPARATFPADHPLPALRSARAVTATCALDAAATARLRATAIRHGTTTFAVSVAAIFALLHRHTGRDRLLAETTISRRTLPQLERQLGCYIDTLPLSGTVKGHETAGDLLRRTAELCRLVFTHADAALDTPAEHQGLDDTGSGLLLDYLPGGTLPAAPPPGLTVTEATPATEQAHADTMFLLSDEAHETLAMRLVFSADLYEQSTVDALAPRLERLLRWLADDGATTLSAVPLIEAPTGVKRRLRVTLNTD